MNTHNSINNYFKYQTIGFIILCIKSDIVGGTPSEIVGNLFETFAYIYLISIQVGLASMFTQDFYLYLKKNGTNEWNKFCICI